MGITYLNFTNGNTMAVTATETEFARGVDWLNTGIVTTDIIDSSVTAEHVYRPETLGWPSDRTIGVLEQLHDRRWGVDAITDTDPNLFRSAARDSVRPQSLLQSGTAPVPRTGVRFSIQSGSADVEIGYVWEMWPKGDFVTAGNNVYPDFAGSMIVASQRRDTAGAAKTTYGYSRRYIPARYLALGIGNLNSIASVSHWSTGIYERFGEGVHDVWLEYQAGTLASPGSVVQMIILARTAVCEVHERT